jgi:hypothetical protein
MRFHNKRGTVEQWIEGRRAGGEDDPAELPRFRSNEVRLRLCLAAYNPDTYSSPPLRLQALAYHPDFRDDKDRQVKSIVFGHGLLALLSSSSLGTGRGNSSNSRSSFYGD